MTEQEWNELGRRAVASKGWRWMPGMLVFVSPLFASSPQNTPQLATGDE